MQTCALHALSVIAENATFEFTPHIRPTLESLTSQLLAIPTVDVAVLQCAGTVCAQGYIITSQFMITQLLNTLVGALGPELQTDSATRTTVMALFAELHLHTGLMQALLGCIANISIDVLVQLASLNGIQQLILFVSSQIDVPGYVPTLQVEK